MIEHALDTLEGRVRGRLVRRDAAHYDEVRSVWNAMIDRRPLAIVRCETAEDVAETVRLAAGEGLPLAVRGGGHNIAGSGVCEDGLVIDLSLMREVEVDPGARSARVGGGALLGDLDAKSQNHGLATPAGVVSSTGIGGLALGGGFGWLSRRFGLTADNLKAAEVITADGRLVRADADENPELFWALRGGGGNFGVVTSFTFALHELGPEVLFGPTFFAIDEAAEVLRTYRGFTRESPRETCVWADLMTAPPLPFIPERHHGTKVLALMQCHSGDVAEGEAVLAPLTQHPKAIAGFVAPTSYAEAQSRLDPVYAAGARNYWKTHNYKDLPDAVIDTLVEMARAMPTAESDILISQLGGAIDEAPADATAFAHRGIGFIVTPGARWHEPADDERCLAWLQHYSQLLARHESGGAYVNFVAETEGRERAAFGANYERLARIKARWDPHNLFRINQNVRPAA